MLALAHQPAVRVAQAALLIGTRPLIELAVERLPLKKTWRCSRAATLASKIRPLRLGSGLGLGVEIEPVVPPTDRAAPHRAQKNKLRHADEDPPRHVPSRCLSAAPSATEIASFRMGHHTLRRDRVSREAVKGFHWLVNLRPVNAHDTDLHKLQLLGQQQNLHRDSRATAVEVLGAHAVADRRSWPGWHVDAYEAGDPRQHHRPGAAATIRRLELNPGGVAVDQQRQHSCARVILR